MNAFQFIIGKKIIDIQRIDTMEDYEFYSPIGIVISLKNITEKLIISRSDIRFESDNELDENYGFEFWETILNKLKPGDELNLFINERIKNIRIAEFKNCEIKGDGFIIKQGKIAGIELITENHQLLFRTNQGNWINIDEKNAELPNPDNWEWK